MTKSKELSDKVDFSEPHAQNVEVGDFLVQNYRNRGYYGSYDGQLITEILAVSKTGIVVREKEEGWYIDRPGLRNGKKLEEHKFDKAIILKRDGTYLVGRSFPRYPENDTREIKSFRDPPT